MGEVPEHKDAWQRVSPLLQRQPQQGSSVRGCSAEPKPCNQCLESGAKAPLDSLVFGSCLQESEKGLMRHHCAGGSLSVGVIIGSHGVIPRFRGEKTLEQKEGRGVQG